MVVMTQTQYAKHRGVTQGRISQLSKEGRLVLTSTGLVVVEDSDRALAASINPSQQRKKKPKPEPSKSDNVPTQTKQDLIKLFSTPGSLTESESRIKKNEADTKLKEIAIEKMKGNLYDAAKADSHVFSRFRSARDAMLSIPARISAELAAMSDPFEIQRKLTKEIEQAMIEEMSKLCTT